MSWNEIYTTEEVDNDSWAIINETSNTGHIVLTGLGKESSKFYADLMNEVYNQAKKDIIE